MQEQTLELATQRRTWRQIARTLWLVGAVGSLMLFVLAVPAYNAQLRALCAAPTPADCPFVQLTAIEAQALRRLGLSLDAYATYTLVLHSVASLVFFAVGFLIFWRKSDDWYGLFVSFLLILFGACGVSAVLLTALEQAYPQLSPLSTLIAFVVFPGLGLFLTTFPDGHFVPRWSWIVPVLWVLQALFFETIARWPTPLFAAELLLVWGSTFAIQVYRYRRVHSAVQRQQTKWVLFGFGLAIASIVMNIALTALLPALNAPDSPYALTEGTWIAFLFPILPLTIGIALLRFRLWGIDPILSRALVYGGLTLAVLGVYVLLVGYLGVLFRTSTNLAISLLATGVVAVLFQPLRERLQRQVNRLLYGQRDEPEAALRQLGRRLEETYTPDSVLPVIVQTVAETLRLPYAAIALHHDEETAITAAFGTASPSPQSLPLSYGGVVLGELRFDARVGEARLSGSDLRLLEDLARQAGVAVHAVRLRAELQRSRERLVNAREEERRRLRRDLHDGLGPTLASFAQRLDSAGTLIQRDPQAASTLVYSLRDAVRATIADIRRLVYALRPPALDEYGLAAALREQGAQILGGGVTLTVDAPEHLIALPAATEVAAYRIALEALTNTARHASARRCSVQIRCSDGWLHLSVADDGHGLPAAYKPGVGIMAMRERAEELGGLWQVEAAAPAGTIVRARLPLE
jgi:signal transduction histidine kinase